MTKIDRRRAAKQLALAENLMLAPMVMAMRVPIMAAEAAESALGGRSESAGAISEKIKAIADGMVAAQLAWMKGAMLLPMSLAKASSPNGPLMDMANDITLAALQPAANQVRLNHRRLSRRKGK